MYALLLYVNLNFDDECRIIKWKHEEWIGPMLRKLIIHINFYPFLMVPHLLINQIEHHQCVGKFGIITLPSFPFCNGAWCHWLLAHLKSKIISKVNNQRDMELDQEERNPTLIWHSSLKQVTNWLNHWQWTPKWFFYSYRRFQLFG